MLISNLYDGGSGKKQADSWHSRGKIEKEGRIERGENGFDPDARGRNIAMSCPELLMGRKDVVMWCFDRKIK